MTWTQKFGGINKKLPQPVKENNFVGNFVQENILNNFPASQIRKQGKIIIKAPF
jgi:hypothetical protein